MSFQYINPQNNYIYPQNLYSKNPAGTMIPQMPYVQNPYGASFYNELNTYPYNNPLYKPVITPAYTKLGVTSSPTGEIVHIFKLANGQNVAIMPRKDEATIVKTFVNAGSMNEIDKHRGVMHVDEHGLFKGSSKLKDGDVFRLTSLMGASTNASTDYAKVDYYITAPFMDDENLAKAIEIQGDMISNPLFDKTAMESEKGPVCSEISMINDDPMTSAFDKTIRNLFQIQSGSKNLVAGSIETVKDLTTDDMKHYHSTYYTPENLTTVVVGDVDVNKTINLIAQDFSAKPSTAQKHYEKLNPITNPIREDIRSSKTNYTNVILGFAGPKPADGKDFIILSMINYYLSSCSSSDFKNTLEKMSASFDAASQKVGLNKNDPYALINVIALNPNDEQKGLDAFYDAVIKLQTQPLSDDDMKSISNYINKALALTMCDSEDICDMLGGCILDDSLDLFSNYLNIANSITKQDIMNFARKYYDLNKVAITVVHPTSVSNEDIKNNYEKSKYSMQNLKQTSGIITFKGNNKNISTKSVEQFKLENNTHVAINTTNSNLCVFNWSVNTPPVKPKNPNIPAVLRYIFEKGTDYKTQSELERFKELNGIDADVYVNGKSIEITANCLPEEAQKTLKLMNELMYHPKFTENDFNEAKRYVKDVLKASQKDATSNLLDKLYPGYFPTDANMLKEIDKLKLSDIEEFYNSMLSNASSAFIATIPNKQSTELKNQVIINQNQGNIQFKELTPKLYPIFKANPQSNVIYDTDDLNQAQIYKSYQFPMSGNIEDEIKFELLNTILGGTPNSRLFSDLREEQNLAYSVSSSVQAFENSGIITLKIQTTTDNPDSKIHTYENVEKSLEGFKKHTDKLMNEYVSDEELSAAKMRLKQNIIGQCQNPLSETGLLAMNILEPYGIARIDKYYQAIDKITKEDIKRAANYVFSHNPTISILASEDTISSQMDYLKTQGVMQKAS